MFSVMRGGCGGRGEVKRSRFRLHGLSTDVRQLQADAGTSLIVVEVGEWQLWSCRVGVKPVTAAAANGDGRHVRQYEKGEKTTDHPLSRPQLIRCFLACALVSFPVLRNQHGVTFCRCNIHRIPLSRVL